MSLPLSTARRPPRRALSNLGAQGWRLEFGGPAWEPRRRSQPRGASLRGGRVRVLRSRGRTARRSQPRGARLRGGRVGVLRSRGGTARRSQPRGARLRGGRGAWVWRAGVGAEPRRRRGEASRGDRAGGAKPKPPARPAAERGHWQESAGIDASPTGPIWISFISNAIPNEMPSHVLLGSCEPSAMMSEDWRTKFTAAM